MRFKFNGNGNSGETEKRCGVEVEARGGMLAQNWWKKMLDLVIKVLMLLLGLIAARKLVCRGKDDVGGISGSEDLLDRIEENRAAQEALVQRRKEWEARKAKLLEDLKKDPGITPEEIAKFEQDLRGAGI